MFESLCIYMDKKLYILFLSVYKNAEEKRLRQAHKYNNCYLYTDIIE